MGCRSAIRRYMRREGEWTDAHFKSFHPRSPSAFPSPSVVSPFIWAKRNLHNEHVKRVIRAKEAKAGGRIVALLMSLPDIRDGAFQSKILPHTVKPSPRGTLLLCFNAELGRGPWRSVGRYPMGTARGKLLAKELKRQLPSLEKGRREFECPSAAMGWDETAARPIPVSAPWT